MRSSKPKRVRQNIKANAHMFLGRKEDNQERTTHILAKSNSRDRRTTRKVTIINFDLNEIEYMTSKLSPQSSSETIFYLMLIRTRGQSSRNNHMLSISAEIPFVRTRHRHFFL